MAVHLTRIYTRTGDDGTTGLANFARVPKWDARLEAYADCDETGAALGVAVAEEPDSPHAALLRQIQNDLFDAGADLSTPIEAAPKHPQLRITDEYIERLEQWIDQFNADLPTLNSFILAGGTTQAAHLHMARTIARRAERAAWRAHEAYPDTTSALPARYLNRLSDLLFVLARVANHGNDVLWQPGGSRTTKD